MCSRLHFDLRKHFTQKPFIFKNVVFGIFTKKRGSKRYFFPKLHQTVVHINAQIWPKISSISSAHVCTEMEKKRDRNVSSVSIHCNWTAFILTEKFSHIYDFFCICFSKIIH